MKLALPAVGENLLVTMVYLVDTLLIGWLKDPAALAAVSLGGLFLNIANQLFSAVSVSATALVAHAWGAGDYERARQHRRPDHCRGRAVRRSSHCRAVAASDIHCSSSWALANELLLWAAQYMRIILVTSLLGFPMVVLNGIMRGSGDTRTPMMITLIMNIYHVLAAIALIFGPGPLPALGLTRGRVGHSLGTAPGWSFWLCFWS